jgi:uncharacterized membrane protein
MTVTDLRPTGDRSRLSLALLLIVAGVMHFVAPKFYEPLIPEELGDARAWVYATGLAEMAAGGLTAMRRTARLGALASLAVFVLVYPGNIKMALDAGRPHDPASWAAWLRLPLQFPLFWWAWRVAERARPAAD